MRLIKTIETLLSMKVRLAATFFGMLICFLLTSGSVRAQTYQTNPDVAYWNAFNQHMTPVYNGARTIQRYSNGVINYGTRLIPRQGTLRNGYNQSQRFVQRNVTLPQRYYPNRRR